jgi:hypothetical protein
MGAWFVLAEPVEQKPWDIYRQGIIENAGSLTIKVLKWNAFSFGILTVVLGIGNVWEVLNPLVSNGYTTFDHDVG